ncbi:MAG: hypothetical protein WBC92_12630, partial [Terracidiphilus sp.]
IFLVESRQNSAANGHGQQPVARVDGKEIGAPVFIDVLREERRRHKAYPAHDAEFCASGEIDGACPRDDMGKNKGQEKAGDERGDGTEASIFRLFAFCEANELPPGLFEDNAVPKSSEQPLNYSGNRNPNQKVMKL